jgi:hypothetical protein
MTWGESDQSEVGNRIINLVSMLLTEEAESI